jgi:hypothetical protein
MIHAVRNIHFNEYHADSIELCNEAFEDLLNQQKKVINMLQRHNKNENMNEEDEFDVFAETEKEIAKLKTTCDHAFKKFADSLQLAEDKQEERKQTLNFQKKDLQGIENNSSNDKSEKNIVDESKNSFHIGIQKTTIINRFDTDAKEGPNRMSLSFILFHTSEFISTIDMYFNVKKNMELISFRKALNHRHKHKRKHDTSIYSLNNYKIDSKFSTKMFTKPLAKFFSEIKKHVKSHMDDAWKKTLTGLRTALLLGIAYFMVMYPPIVRTFEHGFFYA